MVGGEPGTLVRYLNVCPSDCDRTRVVPEERKEGTRELRSPPTGPSRWNLFSLNNYRVPVVDLFLPLLSSHSTHRTGTQTERTVVRDIVTQPTCMDGGYDSKRTLRPSRDVIDVLEPSPTTGGRMCVPEDVPSTMVVGVTYVSPRLSRP